ncbi:uncharacterized protein LOC142769252 isoform X2 [Rhipicephalus microplus]|uniref:uncharacterized protein LOC142769252 isoform X2 n=1 Tax=Rhipicephalus microplus TaxID=6941 RepID=UPI003F6B0263
MEPYNIWIFLVVAMVTPPHLSAHKKSWLFRKFLVLDCQGIEGNLGKINTREKGHLHGVSHPAGTQRVSRPASKYVPQKSLPYLFMLTNPMYLHLTTRGIPGVACIKAIRTEMNPTARTLSQVLVFKSSQKWSYDYEYVDYTPIWKSNKKVRGFTSINKSYKQVCEVWVNDQFFDRNTNGLRFCTANFFKYCKPHTPKQYFISECDERIGKVILV